jgi:hypothetical protein
MKTPMTESQSVVFLYNGRLDGESTAEEFNKLNPSEKVVPYDICEDKDQDMLGPTYNMLMLSAIAGRMKGVVAGPNCKSWSVLLQRSRKGFPSQKKR